MKYLPSPAEIFSIQISDYLDRVVENRNQPFKTVLNDNLDTLKAEAMSIRANHIQGLIVDVQSLWDATEYAKNFEYLYNDAQNERAFIRETREKYIGKLCPFCGCASCTTLDHYYPKIKVPQFAIIPDNLIPACGDCNTEKDEFTPLTSNKRILHPYFDEFIQSPIMRIQLSVVNSVKLIQLVPHPSLSGANQSVVSFHIREMQLESRLYEFICTEIGIQKDAIIDAIENGETKQTILERMKRQVNKQAERGNCNVWGIIILESITGTTGMLDLLITEWD